MSGSSGSSSRSKLSSMLQSRVVTFVLGTIFAAIVASIFQSLSSYHIFSLSREVKELRVTVLANTSLVEVKESIKEKITITYQDRNISNLSSIEVKVENSGNQPIRKSDYEEGPLKLAFPSGAEVVGTEVIASRPERIQKIENLVQRQRNIAVLSPTLLNAGEQFIIRILVTNVPPDYKTKPFTTDGAIAGGKTSTLRAIDDRQEEQERHSPNWIWIIVQVLFSYLAIAVLYEIAKRIQPKSRNP